MLRRRSADGESSVRAAHRKRSALENVVEVRMICGGDGVAVELESVDISGSDQR